MTSESNNIDCYLYWSIAEHDGEAPDLRSYAEIQADQHWLTCLTHTVHPRLSGGRQTSQDTFYAVERFLRYFVHVQPLDWPTNKPSLEPRQFTQLRQRGYFEDHVAKQVQYCTERFGATSLNVRAPIDQSKLPRRSTSLGEVRGSTQRIGEVDEGYAG